MVGRGPGRDHAVHALVFMQALFTYIRSRLGSYVTQRDHDSTFDLAVTLTATLIVNTANTVTSPSHSQLYHT